MQPRRTGPTAGNFGEDAEFNRLLSEKSLENIIEAYNYHAREAESWLKIGAEQLRPEALVKGHIHLAVSEALLGVLRQFESHSARSEALAGPREYTQFDADEAAEEYLKNPAVDFSFLLVRNPG
ncbi:hypothetical protein DU258_21160 [Salmonella enterica subsp. enterica]|nr:hypothetical protein [Salmonella enterica subsp. enterica serovar Kambole]ECG3342211.1 hypothetical protein [Salmonella enterica subsp. enterica serovar Kambole]ECO3184072.1 hypothetical protein [Salmonella enterica subsp. enterica serovar Kambole]ECY5576835.1 hypothetical protein [Salmonella enterica subsp. enterica serovar Kambole]EDN3629719.1 hypothetical protein [Salmonella enterica subsp. enterica serovar Kambole]